MKSILMSIRPEWCELIASGKKTIEVRKTIPKKLKAPFRCYIYCTKDKPILGRGIWQNGNGTVKDLTICEEYDFDIYNKNSLFRANGKVIGEFVCDEIIDYPYIDDGYSSSYGYFTIMREALNMMRIDLNELEIYGDGKTLFGLHISDLVIYDKPKELSEFIKIGDCDAGPKCKKCPYFEIGVEAAGLEDDCIAPFDTSCYSPITRAPQSWCYVEN